MQQIKGHDPRPKKRDPGRACGAKTRENKNDDVLWIDEVTPSKCSDLRDFGGAPGWGERRQGLVVARAAGIVVSPDSKKHGGSKKQVKCKSKGAAKAAPNTFSKSDTTIRFLSPGNCNVVTIVLPTKQTSCGQSFPQVLDRFGDRPGNQSSDPSSRLSVETKKTWPTFARKWPPNSAPFWDPRETWPLSKKQIKAVEKTLRGKVQKQTFPLNLQIPHNTRDSHFATASTATNL
jgi:hypothetical protein